MLNNSGLVNIIHTYIRCGHVPNPNHYLYGVFKEWQLGRKCNDTKKEGI
jgi:hypothetical protein